MYAINMISDPFGAEADIRNNSQDVAEIQDALNAAGASPVLTVDGIWGPLTEAATMNFQAGAGLDADGIPGPETLDALGVQLPDVTGGTGGDAGQSVVVDGGGTSGGGDPSPTTHIPSGWVTDVLTVQEDLIALGYSVGSTGADGVLGPNTLAGVKAYQKARGLKVDGIVGPKTYAQLDLDMQALDGGNPPPLPSGGGGGVAPPAPGPAHPLASHNAVVGEAALVVGGILGLGLVGWLVHRMVKKKKGGRSLRFAMSR